MRIMILVFGLTACGSSDDKPSSCDPSKRSGTYLLEWKTLSGNCGDIPSQLVRWETNAMGDTSCTLTAPDTLSGGNCKISRSFSCDSAIGRIDYIAITTQETSDGSRITGKVTASVQGGATCSGTYAVTYTRQ